MQTFFELTLEPCRSNSKKKKYLELLSKAWAEKGNAKILCLFDVPNVGCGCAFYEDFVPELHEFFPTAASLINHPAARGKLILLILTPSIPGRSSFIPVEDF